jgi:hypothetical protein
MKRFSKYAALALLTASFAAPMMADSDGVTPQDVKQEAHEKAETIKKNSKDAAHRTKKATKRAAKKAKDAGNREAADIQRSKDAAKAQWEKDHPAATPNQ